MSISAFTEQKTMIALAVSGLGATRPAFFAVYLRWYPPTPYAQKVITASKKSGICTATPYYTQHAPPQAAVSSGLCKKNPAPGREAVITEGAHQDQLLVTGRTMLT